MKPKISPTSPQVDQKHKAEIDRWYEQSLKTIDKPPKQNIVGKIFFLFFIMVLGIFSGVVGAILLVSYGDRVPLLDKIDLLKSSSNSSIFITSGNNGKIFNGSVLDEFLGVTSSTTVQIYSRKSPTEGLGDLYLPGTSLGSALVLTVDGYAVTSQAVISDSTGSFDAVTNDGKIFEVETIVDDPATDLVVFKFNAGKLETVDLAGSSDLEPGTDVMLVKNDILGSTPLYIQSAISHNKYQPSPNLSAALLSSDALPNRLLLSSEVPTLFENAIVYSSAQKAVGILDERDGQRTVIPFYLVRDILGKILESKKITRPFLGVRYLDLSTAVNIPSALSDGRTRGALLYGDEELGIAAVATGSPASQADLRQGDIIISVNGQTLNNQETLQNLVQGADVGSSLEVGYLRDGVEKKVIIPLIEQPE